VGEQSMKKSKRIAAVLLSAVMATSIISAFPASASTLENETSSVTYNWEDQIISGDYQYINLKMEP
jgi:putative salt-induced outer membrane protein YdiY